MNIKVLFVLCLIVYVEARKTSRSRGSGSSRSSSRKTNAQPAPTSFSYPQPAAKPSLSGWQEKPAQKHQPVPNNWQAKPATGQHSYPSSNTGLSGNNNAKQPSSFQENYQKNSAPAQSPPLSSHPNNQPSHSYPSSNGLSGSAGAGSGYPTQSKVGQQHASGQPGAGYPQGSGLSGASGAGYPPQGTGLSGTGAVNQHNAGSGISNTGIAPPPYSGYKPGAQNVNNNYGHNYNHPQGPPPPYHNYGGYSGHGSNYGGYSGGPMYNPGPQMPGYFGNYGNSGRGFGGMSRTGSALTGVGIAGAGVGTILTGLALWNLARSTGQHRHTVIYDNRGQPVAVAPADNSTPEVDPMLANLVNCTLTISNGNSTEILAIPCAIATSFSPDADVKLSEDGSNGTDNTKCIVTVLTKTGKEYMTTIPCSTLLNTAAENNVTEPDHVIDDPSNSTMVPLTNVTNEPTALGLTGNTTNMDMHNGTADRNCDPQLGDIRDPINPCFAVTHNLTVVPLESTVAKDGQ